MTSTCPYFLPDGEVYDKGEGRLCDAYLNLNASN